MPTFEKNSQRMPTPTWLTARTTASELRITPLKRIVGSPSDGAGEGEEARLSSPAAISSPDNVASASASVY